MNPRIVRILGSVLLVLGFASALMRTQLDMDTVLTSWMGGAQPWAGIAMGIVGLGLVVLGNRLMRARAERLERLEDAEMFQTAERAPRPTGRERARTS
ncbi:MAG: hypothetical protein JWP82_906 [Humibacillus sp.]|nr:hypothetical protein [Humibacillus sp.]